MDFIGVPELASPVRMGYRKVPQVQLCLPVADDRAAGVLRDWFTRGWAQLSGRLPELIVHNADLVRRPPNAVVGSVFAQRTDPDPDELLQPYSEQAWGRLLGMLAEFPNHATLQVSVNDSEGRPRRPAMEIISWRFDDPGGAWLLLAVERDDVTLADTDDGEQALLAFLRSIADTCDPGHAEISYASSISWAALEQALNLMPRRTVPRCRQVLRSYSWITVVPQELGERLGGLPALWATGAFHEVAQLEHGGLWLRATPHWRDYDRPAAEQVFRALAPILPPGAPHRGSGPVNVLANRDPTSVF